MKRHHLLGTGLGLLLTFAAAGLPVRAADEPIDYDSLNKIKNQGLVASNSQVMDVASWLTDVHGPRLSGSPGIQKAGTWAVAKMKEWGLENVRMEPWPADASGGNNGFPRGWTNEKFYLAAVSPQAFPIPGTPTAWTPGTNGLVRGEVVLVTETTEEDLKAKYAGGKLRGKWVITSAAPDVQAYWNAPATRASREELARMDSPDLPTTFSTQPAAAGGRGGPGGPGGGRGGQAAGGAAPFNRNAYFQTEGVLGTFSTAPRGHGIYTIGGGSRTADPATLLPAIAIPAEQYGRLARMIGKGVPVTVEADIKNTYTPNPAMFNVIGEIRGTDKADEIVMLGAHFDSWHASTGATDNAAGSAAMMEAMRILKQSGVRLRRTVRIGLWNGEEQGLIGSRLYVQQVFGGGRAGGGGRGGGGGAAAAGGRGGAAPAAAAPPTQNAVMPEHAKFSGYFNIDNGTGSIRGVYLQQNQAVAPIFRAWMEPFRSIGMTTLTISNTGGTDHGSFDSVGLPGFQFIQDPIEYDTMTHHTNLDSYERLQPEDMRRNATIAAAFAFLTANREEKLPRKPPTAPAGGGRGGN
jgi:carboxypeptidase Q